MPSPIFVQGAQAHNNSSGTNVSCAYSSDQIAGNTNVLFATTYQFFNISVSSISDSQGNTYTLAGTFNGSGSLFEVTYCYVCTSVNAGPNTVTVVWGSGSQYLELHILEYHGATGFEAFSSAFSVTGSSGVATLSVTTTVNNEIIVGFCRDLSVSAPPVAGSGVTNRILNSEYGSTTADGQAVLAGAHSLTWTFPNSVWVAVGVAITGTAGTSPTVTAQSATSISPTSATLNGNITSVGSSTATSAGFNFGKTTIYGQISTSSGSFGIGPFSQNVTGLSPGTQYHYQARATNTSGTGTSADNTFTTATNPSVGFPHFSEIFIPNVVNSSFTNIPVPLRITSLDIGWSHIRPDGADIRIISSDAVTPLPYFFERFDYINKLAVIWVLIPSIPALGSVSVFMFYNNLQNTVTTSSYDSVFSKIDPTNPGLIALHHLDEGAGASSADSVGVYPMTLIGSPTWSTSDGGNFGVMKPVQSFASGSSLTFNGSNQYISIPTLLDTQPSSGVTVSMWLSAVIPNLGTNIWSKQNSSTEGFKVQFDSSGCFRYLMQKGGVNTAYNGSHLIRLNQWYHLCFSYGPLGIIAYVDGEADAIVPGENRMPVSGSSYPVQIGAETFGNINGEAWFTGSMDEIAHWQRQLTDWEIKALFRRRPLVQIQDAFSKLVNKSNPIIVAPVGNSVLESNPIVVVAGSSYKNYIHEIATQKLLYYTSTNGVSWTLASSDVLSGSNAFSPSVWVDPFGLYNILVNNVSYVAGNLSHWTSVNGVSWSKQSDILTTGGKFQGFFNSAVVYTNGGISVLVEYLSHTTLAYTCGLWKGPDINHLTYVGDTVGLVYGGGPDIHVVGSKYIVLNHGSVMPSNLGIPSLGQCQQSTDLLNYISTGINPVIQLHGPPYEGDQAADLAVIENFDGQGNLAVYWTGSTDGSTGSNIGSGYAIMMATYAGTLAQWVTDNLTAVFGPEVALPTAPPAPPVQYLIGGSAVMRKSAQEFKANSPQNLPSPQLSTGTSPLGPKKLPTPQ